MRRGDDEVSPHLPLHPEHLFGHFYVPGTVVDPGQDVRVKVYHSGCNKVVICCSEPAAALKFFAIIPAERVAPLRRRTYVQLSG